MSESPENPIPYHALLMDALRGIVREVIQCVSDEGLPGEHHFYITFRTDHPLAELPEAIAAKYPSELRIVLQNQFTNLFVDDFGFHVTLYFGGIPTPLYVPFDALTSFVDPHVKFALHFEPKGMSPLEQELEQQLEQEEEPEPEQGDGTATTTDPRQEGQKGQERQKRQEGEEMGESATKSEDAKASDNVVNLSAFRKN